MASYIYNGDDERVFPSLGITVKPGDIFNAPDNFDVANVTPKSKTKTQPKETGEE